MSEVFISREMIVAGQEAMSEGRKQGLDDEYMVIGIYLAMEAVREISTMREPQDTVH